MRDFYPPPTRPARAFAKQFRPPQAAGVSSTAAAALLHRPGASVHSLCTGPVDDGPQRAGPPTSSRTARRRAAPTAASRARSGWPAAAYATSASASDVHLGDHEGALGRVVEPAPLRLRHPQPDGRAGDVRGCRDGGALGRGDGLGVLDRGYGSAQHAHRSAVALAHRRRQTGAQGDAQGGGHAETVCRHLPCAPKSFVRDSRQSGGRRRVRKNPRTAATASGCLWSVSVAWSWPSSSTAMKPSPSSRRNVSNRVPVVQSPR